MEQFTSSNELINGVTLRMTSIEWDALQPGMSYALPVAQCNIASLYVQASKHGKRLGCKFKVYYHVDSRIVEIGRLELINKMD